LSATKNKKFYNVDTRPPFEKGRRADHHSRILPGRVEARLSPRRRHQHRKDHRGKPEQRQKSWKGQRMHSAV